MSQRVKVATTTQLKPGQSRLVEVDQHEIALFNVNGQFYAIDNACPHRGGPLGEGRLTGPTVTCPWHGAQFDIPTGQRLREPAPTGVTSYTVQVEEDAVFLEIP